jgi:protocatechuate 3,4-dioxygenase beta subunit
MYDRAVADENYLRGVQASAADGSVTFTSIFPACYSGRWPHVHFEVYTSLDEATAAGRILATSQIALPEDPCSTVYATTGYEQSVSNLTRVSLDRDNVFGDDGGVSQLATMSGDVDSGFTAALTVGL